MTTPRKKKAVTKPNNDEADKEICFVIMPFGGWFDKYYEDIYCPAIVAAGMSPRRADDLYRPSNIVQDIWTYTKKAKMILADLSNKNPNVFYELGLAHALAKPAILITQTIDDIPFDLRSLRIIDYDKNLPNWGETLGESIEKAIKETVESPNETIPTAFLETTGVSKTKVSKEELELLELRQEMENLKKEVRTRSYSSRPNSENPSEEEALLRLRSYIRQNLPFDVIVERMTRRYNAPLVWIENNYQKMIKSMGGSAA